MRSVFIVCSWVSSHENDFARRNDLAVAHVPIRGHDGNTCATDIRAEDQWRRGHGDGSGPLEWEHERMGGMVIRTYEARLRSIGNAAAAADAAVKTGDVMMDHRAVSSVRGLWLEIEARIVRVGILVAHGAVFVVGDHESN